MNLPDLEQHRWGTHSTGNSRSTERREDKVRHAHQRESVIGRVRDYGWEQGHHHLDQFWVVCVDYSMSGSNFATASGSEECSFEAAKNTPFDDVVGKLGIVVDNCA